MTAAPLAAPYAIAIKMAVWDTVAQAQLTAWRRYLRENLLPQTVLICCPTAAVREAVWEFYRA
jgi:hypothetical protein